MGHEESILILVNWFEKRGYLTEFEKDGDEAVDRIAKIVFINTSRSKETQLHVMLHEAGHILIKESDPITRGYEVLNKYSHSSKIHKTFTIIEEVEAWKRGLKLAKKLGIEIRKEKWDKDVARAIFKYMMWATGRS